MKSSVKIGYWIGTGLTMGFLLFVFIGMTLDETLSIYSRGWSVFALVLFLLMFLFIVSYLKIPEIKIIGNIIHYKALGKKATFNKADIIELRKVASNINGWYSFRGGIKIITKDDEYEFPFHLYPNQAELLQQLYGVKLYKLDLIVTYSPSYLSYLLYFYKNPSTMYLFFSLAFIWLAFIKTNTVAGKIIFGLISALSILPFLMSSHYVKLEKNELITIHPLLLKSTKIQIKDIESVNTRSISTGKGGIKNITLTFNNKTIKTIPAGLNWQSELDLIANQLNTKL